MKRLGIALMVLVLALFLAGAALAGAPNLTGTTWAGTFSYAGYPPIGGAHFANGVSIKFEIVEQDLASGNFYGFFTGVTGVPAPMTGNVSTDKLITGCVLEPNQFTGEIAIFNGRVRDNKISGTSNAFVPGFIIYTGNLVLTKQE